MQNYKKTKIIVWLPLPPTSGWRGEGIIETVENILSNVPVGEAFPVWTLIVSPSHYHLVNETVVNHPNVSVKRLFGMNFSFKHKEFDKETLEHFFVKPNPWERFLMVFSFISDKISSRKLSLIQYGLFLYLYSFLQNFGWVYRCDYIWFPTPIIPLSEKLRGKKVFSFWDPFIFEYHSFRPQGYKYLSRFSKNFKAANRIVTQSNYNKHYLEKVFNVQASLVSVISNGTNDYRQFKLPKNISSQDFRELALANFSEEIYTGSLAIAFKKYKNSILDKSTLLRLLETKMNTSSSKLIFVSTQFRPHKGFFEFFDVAERLIEDDYDQTKYQFVFTANIPNEILKKYPKMHEHTHIMTRLSKKKHALIYQISDIVIHPSHAEGGLPYPIHEASSLGIPCLINKGRHTNEFMQDHPEIKQFLFDVSKPTEAAKKIRDVLQNRSSRIEIIDIAEKSVRPWAIVAKEFSHIFDKEITL